MDTSITRRQPKPRARQIKQWLIEQTMWLVWCGQREGYGTTLEDAYRAWRDA